MPNETTKLPQKRQGDVRVPPLRDRDIFALTWIGEQYAIRLDHLQRLLGQRPGRDTANEDVISEGAARDVVTRWKKAGWVQTARIRAHEPFWVWPTRLTLRKLGLPYAYKDIERSPLKGLEHLAIINEIRLKKCSGSDNIEWRSSRQLLQESVRSPDQDLLHLPDAEMRLQGVGIIAIEAELSLQKIPELIENVMELIRGEGYLQMRAEHGETRAKKMSQGERSRYAEIWYFAPPKVRKQIRRACARLVQQGDLSPEEADRLSIRWYPLTQTKEEEAQEKREDGDGPDPEESDLDDDDEQGGEEIIGASP